MISAANPGAALDKIIALERDHTQRELAELQVRLQGFEAEYQMPSEDFYRRFHTGELGDDADFFDRLKDQEYELLVKVRTGIIQSVVVSGFDIPVRAIFDEEEQLVTLQTILE